MILRLDIVNFRNLIEAKLEPLEQGFNFIYGNNGSGKTSLLEAIYYLGLGRSFRSSVNNRLITDTADKFSLFAQMETALGHTYPVGIERHQSGETRIRISGKETSTIVDLASLLPVQLINSHCYQLLEAPLFRRKYMDWGSFYSFTSFLTIWKHYERALKQRNAALRGALSKKELDVWTQKLVEYGVQLHSFRTDYLTSLMPSLTRIINQLLPQYNIILAYQAGWNEQYSFEESLDEFLYKDRQLGYTQHGPHRADFKINIQTIPAKDILSRGQQKLLVCAMILAQGMLLESCTNKKSTYLVDDLPSELDNTSRFNLMTQLSQQQVQVFVTAIEKTTLNDFLLTQPTKMFHVEHGKVLPV